MTSADLTKAIEWPEMPVSLELQNAVEQFYYREAQLLDYQNYEAWLALLTQDIQYWMPIRTTHTSRNKAMEYVPPAAMPILTRRMRACVRAFGQGFRGLTGLKIHRRAAGTL